MRFFAFIGAFFYVLEIRISQKWPDGPKIRWIFRASRDPRKIQKPKKTDESECPTPLFESSLSGTWWLGSLLLDLRDRGLI